MSSNKPGVTHFCVSAYLPAPEMARLKALAARWDMTVTSVARQGICAFLDAHAPAETATTGVPRSVWESEVNE